MSIVLTYWQDPPIKRTPDDYDGIREVRVESVRQIPGLVEGRPPHCTMISTEHSSDRTLKSGKRTNFFKIVWEGSSVPGHCSTCGRAGRGGAERGGAERGGAERGRAR